MKVKFTGVPGEDHQAITMYGQSFPFGKSVDVKEPAHQRKLRNHPHFEVVEDAEDAKVKGDSDEPSVDDLRLQAIAMGVDVDYRWGAERLKAEIAKKAK